MWPILLKIEMCILVFTKYNIYSVFSSSHLAKDWYFVSKVSVINSKRPIGGVYSVLRGGTLVWSSTNSLVNFVWPFPKSFEHLGAAEETLMPTLLRSLGGYKSLALESHNWVLQMPRGFLLCSQSKYCSTNRRAAERKADEAFFILQILHTWSQRVRCWGLDLIWHKWYQR